MILVRIALHCDNAGHHAIVALDASADISGTFTHTLIALNLFDHLLLVFDHAGGPADPKVVRQDPPEECLPVFLVLADLSFVLGVKCVLIQLLQLLREWFHLCLPSQDFAYV